MIAYPASLQAVGGARSGIAPANLLDVQDVNGNFYFWSDRKIVAPFAIGADSSIGADFIPPVALLPGQKIAWLLPTTVAAVNGSHVAIAATLAGATMVCNFSAIFSAGGTVTWGWTGAVVPTLPPGAVIDQALLTAQVSLSGDNVPFSTSSIPGGVDLTALSSVIFTAGMDGTAPVGDMLAIATIQNPAIAIYYHLPSSAGSDPFPSSLIPYGYGQYEPWILTVPQLTFHRSSLTDLGSFVLQNLSGDTVSRDFEEIMRKSALEGAFFVYRSWQPDAQASWIEVHGQLTVEDIGDDTVTLKGGPATNPAEDTTPMMQYCETCQWRWSSPQCGATGSTECQYSYQTCQVPERILVVLNDYEKNYGETTANVPTQNINRRRRF